MRQSREYSRSQVEYITVKDVCIKRKDPQNPLFRPRRRFLPKAALMDPARSSAARPPNPPGLTPARGLNYPIKRNATLVARAFGVYDGGWQLRRVSV